MTGMVRSALAAAAILLGSSCLSMVIGGFILGFVQAKTGEGS